MKTYQDVEKEAKEEKSELEKAKKLLESIDGELTFLEDYIKGYSGDTITKIRGEINDFLYGE